MMRIKEAIQRKKLIQQLNDEYADIEAEDYINAHAHPVSSGLPGSKVHFDIHKSGSESETSSTTTSSDQSTANLQAFVNEIMPRMSYPQRRALRVTWKRLSEAPKTSGRGTLQIMEKVFEKLTECDHHIMSVFYRSAFIKCIEDRKNKCMSGSISTIRDHAHLLIDFIDGLLNVMFDQPLQKQVYDPISIGRIHSKLIPLGFDRTAWHKLGEAFAEIMFSQECVRAYPHAASAWSMLIVACTDKMYSYCRDRGHGQRFTDSFIPQPNPSLSLPSSPYLQLKSQAMKRAEESPRRRHRSSHPDGIESAREPREIHKSRHNRTVRRGRSSLALLDSGLTLIAHDIPTTDL